MTHDPRSGILGGLFDTEGESARLDPVEGHLDAEDFAVLLERLPRSPLPAVVVAHLSQCDACRQAIGELLRDSASIEDLAVLPSIPKSAERRAIAFGVDRAAPQPRTPFRWRLAAALAAAATALALAGVALLEPWRATRRVAPSVTRSGAAPRVEVAMTPSGVVDAREPLVFEWPRVEGASAYVLSVSDPTEGSEIVLEIRTHDDRHSLSAEERARLTPGRSYQWLVRAERGVGRVEAGPVAEFTLLAIP